MLSRIDLRGRSLGTAELRRTLPRGAADVDSVVDTVRPVVEAVVDTAVRGARRREAICPAEDDRAGNLLASADRLAPGRPRRGEMTGGCR